MLANSDSALYELSGRLDLISLNVARVLLGNPTQGSLAGLYLVFDVLVVALTAVRARVLVGLLRRAPRPWAGRLALPRRVVFGWVLPI